MKKSIILITYGRHQELIDTIKCILPYDSEDLQLLILDNNIENRLEKEINNLLIDSKIRYTYYWEGKNYGVALGRNYLIEKADGEYIITLDDDVDIENIGDLIDKVEYNFNENPTLGCQAFKIINYYTRKALSHEIPHGNKKLDFSVDQYTSYFIGAGHAIRKSVYENAGVYPDYLGLYGGEELDLSFRIIDNKWKILYTSNIEIYHKVSPDGRMSTHEQAFMKYQNRLKVVYRYMPFIYVLTNIFIWSGYYCLKEKRVINVFKSIKNLKTVNRTKISKDAVKYLKEVQARLLY